MCVCVCVCVSSTNGSQCKVLIGIVAQSCVCVCLCTSLFVMTRLNCRPYGMRTSVQSSQSVMDKVRVYVMSTSVLTKMDVQAWRVYVCDRVTVCVGGGGVSVGGRVCVCVRAWVCVYVDVCVCGERWEQRRRMQITLALSRRPHH